MELNRVILSSDNNPLYYDFWNNLSKTYSQKFGIVPTLIFFGTHSEFKNAGLSDNYGEIVFEKKVNGVSTWQYTWALFYYTKFYQEEVCAIMGIDQIPLGTYFLRDVIKDVPIDNYVMLIDDQYKLERKFPHKWDEGGFSPSAYHMGKGRTFSDVFSFEDSFEDEIKKINYLPIPTMWGDKWGMDEAYSCKKLREYKNRERISDLSLSKDFLSRRIDCHRQIEVDYDVNMLQNNFFIECHSCRPYHNHKQYIDNMFNNIKKYK